MLPSSTSLRTILAGLALCAGPAAAQSVVRMPTAPGPVPVVVMLPDAGMPAQRMQPHAERLNSLGIATIEPAGGISAAALADELAALLREASNDRRFDGGRIAILGFGAGGRVALEGAGPHAVAALYPGCRALRSQGTGPALLLDDADTALSPDACDRFHAGLGARVTQHHYLAAGGDWDVVEGAAWDSLLWLPVAHGPASGPTVAQDAALRVARFMAQALEPVRHAAMARQ